MEILAESVPGAVMPVSSITDALVDPQHGGAGFPKPLQPVELA